MMAQKMQIKQQQEEKEQETEEEEESVGALADDEPGPTTSLKSSTLNQPKAIVANAKQPTESSSISEGTTLTEDQSSISSESSSRYETSESSVSESSVTETKTI